jgi:hypothetical protein
MQTATARAKKWSSQSSITLYTIFSTLITSCLFVLVFATLTMHEPIIHWCAATIPNVDKKTLTIAKIFLETIMLVLITGALGGCLYNFRSLVKYVSEGKFRACCCVSYYIRPFAGAVCGLIAFFLLLGGALTLNISNIDANHLFDIKSNGEGVIPYWQTILGRLPYMALALLAGYASYDFMLKLNEIAEALFRHKDYKDPAERRDDAAPSDPQPKAETPTDKPQHVVNGRHSH